VEVTLDTVRDGGCLIIRIRDGPRYRMGDIRIDGSREIDANKLRQKLLAPAKDESNGSQAALLRRTILALSRTEGSA
jgi:hypothetical protein